MKNQRTNEYYYNNISKIYDEKHLIDMSDYSVFHRQMRKLLKSKILKSGFSIIDCGCGTGRGALKFGKMGCKVTAVDISENIVESCKKNANKLGIPIETAVEDCTNLSFPANHFDGATLSAALHHMEDIDKCLEEFYRVIKPGGMLILIAEPKESKIRPEWVRKKKEYLSNMYDEKNIGFVPPKTNPDVHVFNIDILKTKLHSIGFIDVRIESFFFLSSIYRDLFFFRIQNKKIRKLLLKICQWIDEIVFFWLHDDFYALFNLVAYKSN